MMNLLRKRRRGVPPAAESAGAAVPPVQPRPDVPEVHAFVDVAINAGRSRESVPVNSIRADALVTRTPAGLQAGDAVDFVYTNDAGRFRFATVCTRVEGREAEFPLPAEIKTIESFANRRAAPRLPWLAPAQWRYAMAGAGYGTFLPASTMDVSSCGMSIVVAQRLTPGAQLEVRFALEPEREPVVAISEVVRATKLEKSDKNAAGIRFIDVSARQRQFVGQFVNEQQLARRQRGVV